MAVKRQRLARRRKASGYTQEEFAEALRVDRTTVQRWERGDAEPQPHQRPKLAKLLRLTSRGLDELLAADVLPAADTSGWLCHGEPADDAEVAAWELARRVQASDVGPETLTRLETAFDDLAMAYPVTPPVELLERVRKHSAYVVRLLDARMTLAEHRRLLVVGGWLSLLGATLHIDLEQERAATAGLQAATTLARQADHPEIEAWCFETDAWRVLTTGDYPRALDLSLAAQSVAPKGSSALIQATAQEGRARARLGQAKETYAAVDRVQKMSAALVAPQRPREHHYQYDPAKCLAYTATTLAWLGDAAAEPYAREVIKRLGPSEDVGQWPRRVASANIDLGLVLLAGDRLDEACDAVRKAILSGRVVPSNHWRALEVVRVVEARRLSEASDLREAYEGLRAR
ncbi:helix-turn-helix transcriptional regulator [Streptomyces sp. JW3]|uniref:helix-turn-helix transcriptional regulator n=1 Tax=Streptomyces sp. JW3 TaxID=3456955 RepID=UPI003FA41EBE